MADEGFLQEEAILDRRLRHHRPNQAHQAQDPADSIPDETVGLLSEEIDDAHEQQPAGGAPNSDPEWHGDRDFEGWPWWKKPSIYWLLPAFALYTVAFGGVLVPKINLVQDLVCRDYLSDQMFVDPSLKFDPIRYGDKNPECDIPAVSGRAALFLMGDNILGGILGALVAPYLGDLSDRFGRTPLLVFTSFGGLIKEITSIFAATYPETFSLGYFYLGFVADGLCGSFIAGLAIAHSYATDCTPPARRNVAFGFFQGVLFTGIGIGPLLAGYIIKWTGTLLSMFYIALVCHVIFILTLLFIVPESLSKRRQHEARVRYEHEKSLASKEQKTFLQSVKDQSKAIVRPLKILWPTGEGSSSAVRRNLVLLCSIDTIMFGVAMGAMTVIVIYVRKEFGFGNLEQSQMVSAISVVRVVCLFGVLPTLTRVLRGPQSKGSSGAQTGCDWVDLVIIRVAILFDVLGFLGYTLSHTGPLFILSGCVAALGGIASPTMQSALTKHVPADKTGQLLGASAMLHALARVVAPLTFSTIFYATVETFSQAVFMCLMITFAAAWILTWFLRPGVYVNDTSAAAPGVVEDANEAGAVGRE